MRVSTIGTIGLSLVALAAVVGYVVIAVTAGTGKAPEVLIGVATTAIGVLAPSPVGK